LNEGSNFFAEAHPGTDQQQKRVIAMRTTWNSKVIGAVAASFLLVPMLATASSVEDQLNQMQDRMGQLEDQLRATNDELTVANDRADEQAGVIERAGLADENSGVSSLSSFLSDTDFYGWVNASYMANTHSAHSAGINGQNTGVANIASVPMPNYPDNQTFKVNQVWFGMDNAATADSRGGFHVDLFYGADAGEAHLNGFGCGNANVAGGGDTNAFCVFTAYASYLAPIGPNGVEIQAGKLPTMLGAEVVQTPWNFNISRGLLWSLQPVANLGAVVSADLGGGFGIAAGVIDSPLALQDPDNNIAKSFTGQVSWSNDKFGAALSGNWGEVGGNTTASILDLVLSADPTDSLSLWLNFDWVNQQGGNQNPLVNGNRRNDVNKFGLGIAGRYAITDMTGIAVRGEWVGSTVNGTNTPPGTMNQWSTTLTADHHLTDNLMVRGEFRYDGAQVNTGSNNVFCGSGGGGCVGSHAEQFSFIVDMTYEF
jgi:hypothetical protein